MMKTWDGLLWENFKHFSMKSVALVHRKKVTNMDASISESEGNWFLMDLKRFTGFNGIPFSKLTVIVMIETNIVIPKLSSSTLSAVNPENTYQNTKILFAWTAFVCYCVWSLMSGRCHSGKQTYFVRNSGIHSPFQSRIILQEMLSQGLLAVGICHKRHKG